MHACICACVQTLLCNTLQCIERRTPIVTFASQDMCNDANLRVTLTKVLKPDQLVLVIFLTNQKQTEITGVNLSIELPSNMKTTSGELTLTTNISGFGNVR